MISKFGTKLLLIFLLPVFTLVSYPLFADRLKDLTSIAGVRSNQLVGYGIVVGLAGTGDGNIGLTLQSMQFKDHMMLRVCILEQLLLDVLV